MCTTWNLLTHLLRDPLARRSPVTAQTPSARSPVVLRCAGMFPAQISNYEVHRLRLYGDLGHVRSEASDKNRLLIGDEDWAAKAQSEI
jgi:hypothetical protein